MANTDPEKLKKRLGINSWQELSKDRVLAFVSELPRLDKEVALDIVRQFPNFKELATSGLDKLQAQADQAAANGDKGQERLHQSFMQSREILSKELDRPNLSPEDRLHIMNLLSDLLAKEALLESDNRDFQERLVKYVVAGVTVVAAIGGAILGVNTNRGRGA